MRQTVVVAIVTNAITRRTAGHSAVLAVLLSGLSSCNGARSGRIEEGNRLTYEEVLPKISESSLLFSYLKSALSAREEDGISAFLDSTICTEGGQWIVVESYEVDSGSCGVIAIVASGDTKWRLLTNYAQGSDGDPLDVSEGTIAEYQLTNKQTERIIRELGTQVKRSPPINGAWGDETVFDGMGWFVANSNGTRCFLYGYGVPALEDEDEEIPLPPEGDAQKSQNAVGDVLRLWLQVREGKPVATRKVRA